MFFEQTHDASYLGLLCNQRRKELGLDQATVSMYANVSVKFISQFECGKTSVQLDKVLALTSTLGIRLHPISKDIDLGKLVKESRSVLGFTQASLAGFSGLSTKFISNLEANKPTLMLDKVLVALHTLGVKMEFKT
ncbi:MAG: helix-turn-helix domain-containing protein [Bermanella sp.]